MKRKEFSKRLIKMIIDLIANKLIMKAINHSQNTTFIRSEKKSQRISNECTKTVWNENLLKKYFNNNLFWILKEKYFKGKAFLYSIGYTTEEKIRLIEKTMISSFVERIRLYGYLLAIEVIGHQWFGNIKPIEWFAQWLAQNHDYVFNTTYKTRPSYDFLSEVRAENAAKYQL